MGVKSIIFNWHQCGSIIDDLGAGEDYCKYVVGLDGVVSIEEHIAAGEGDKWNYLIEFQDGSFTRIFNPNIVDYFKK